MTIPLRDYNEIEEKNCQLVTHYGGKKFGNPRDVTTGPNDEVVIADCDNKEVIIFDKDLKLIRTFGQGSGDGKLNNLVGVAVGYHVIAVSDYTGHVVKKYSLQGDYLSKVGSYGSGDGQFKFPLGLCFNSKGLLQYMLWMVVTAEFRCSERIMCSILNLAPMDIFSYRIILLWTALTKCM